MSGPAAAAIALALVSALVLVLERCTRTIERRQDAERSAHERLLGELRAIPPQADPERIAE